LNCQHRTAKLGARTPSGKENERYEMIQISARETGVVMSPTVQPWENDRNQNNSRFSP